MECNIPFIMKRRIEVINETNVPGNVYVFLFILLTLFIPSCTEDPEVPPILNTIQVQDADITSTSAKLKGEITSLGNQKIIEYGIEYSKNMLFDPSTTKGFTTPAVTGVFTVECTNLDPNTLYYYKAYVLINTANVYSQNNLHFTTKAK